MRFPYILVFLGIVGCSGQLVTSSSVTESSVSSGIMYSLPQQLVEITLSETSSGTNSREQAIANALASRNAAAKLLATKEAELRVLTGTLQAIADQSGAAATGIRTKIAKAEAERLVLRATLDYREAELNRARNRPPQAGNTPSDSANLTVRLLPISADPDYTFVANLDHRAYRSDELKITTTAGGLLSGASGFSQDQSSSIASKIISTIVATQGGGPSPMLEMVSQCEEFTGTRKWIIDPTDDDERRRINLELQKFCFKVDAVEVGRTRSTSSGQHTSGNGACSDIANAREVISCSRSAGNKGQTDQTAPGLFYRQSRPWRIELQLQDTPNSSFETASEVTVFLPNASPIALLEFETGPLVKTEYDVIFENGMLTSADMTRPSEALAAAGLPLEVVSAVVGSVTDLIQLKFDISSKEKGLVTSQKELIDALLALEQSRAALEAAASGQQSATEE